MKEWLDQNKIYFETVAAIFLTLMSITVSISQCSLSTKQTKISMVESQPRLEFLIPEVDKGKYFSYGTKVGGKDWVSYNISVTNNGNSGIKDFTFSYESFLSDGKFGCDEINFNNMKSPGFFPSYISPGEVHTMNVIHYSETEESDWITGVVTDQKPFLVKFSGKYKVEGFPKREVNLKVVYVVSYSNPIVICKDIVDNMI